MVARTTIKPTGNVNKASDSETIQSPFLGTDVSGPVRPNLNTRNINHSVIDNCDNRMEHKGYSTPPRVFELDPSLLETQNENARSEIERDTLPESTGSNPLRIASAIQSEEQGSGSFSFAQERIQVGHQTHEVNEELDESQEGHVVPDLNQSEVEASSSSSSAQEGRQVGHQTTEALGNLSQ